MFLPITVLLAAPLKSSQQSPRFQISIFVVVIKRRWYERRVIESCYPIMIGEVISERRLFKISRSSIRILSFLIRKGEKTQLRKIWPNLGAVDFTGLAWKHEVALFIFCLFVF